MKSKSDKQRLPDLENTPKIDDDAVASLHSEQNARFFAPVKPSIKQRKSFAFNCAEAMVSDGECDELECLRYFKTCVFHGATPPVSLLIFVAERLAAYFSGDGKITLDRAFNVHSRQRRGSALDAEKLEERRYPALKRMYELRKTNRISIENAANEVVGELQPDIESDALKKLYINKHVEQNMDEAAQIMQEEMARIKNRGK